MISDQDSVGDNLVNAALGGDENAFRQLVDQMNGTLGRLVFKIIDRKTLIKEGASDIIQDCFLKAWNKKHQLRDRTTLGFQNWIIQIIGNEVKTKQTYWRREIRDIDREHAIAPGSTTGLPIAAPEESTGKLHRDEVLWQGFNELPSAQREALRLQKFEGWKHSQIASRLGCSEYAVQGLLRRAKQALAQYLRENGLGDE